MSFLKELGFGLVTGVMALGLFADEPKQAVPPPASHPDGMQPYTEVVRGTEVSIPMTPVPAGTEGYPKSFTMGSPSGETGRGDDEGPTFRVEVEPFWIGTYEITWDTYNQFRRQYSIQLDRRLSQRSAAPETWADAVSIPTPLWEQDAAPILEGLGQKGGYPVADVTLYAALQFTKWLTRKTGRTYRLPTEAEWEYAARAGTQTAYFFGDSPDPLGDYAWNFDTSAYGDADQGYPGAGAGYRKVGLKKPSPWGLYDIYGNVSEWVMDQYREDAYARHQGKTVSWKDAIEWPTRIFPGVVRGGNWESEPAGCRSAARLASNRKWQRRDPQIPKSLWWHTDAFHVGFRVLRPLRDLPKSEGLRFWDPPIAKIEEIVRQGGKQLRISVGKR